MRTMLAASVALALAGTSAATAAASGHAAAVHVRRACAVTHRPGVMSCMALIRTDVRQRFAASIGRQKPVGFGYGPPALQSAYNLPSATAGVGETVAVV